MSAWQPMWSRVLDANPIADAIALDLDYRNDRYRALDSGILVEKPWADIVNNYSAPAGRTYFDSSGVLQTAAANTPIRAFDPATGEFLGNQIWGSYRNKYDYSLDFLATGWQRQNAAFVANVITAPDGTLTGGKLSENTSNSNHRLASAAYSGSGFHAASFVVKAAERTRCMVFLYDGAARRAQTIFDLSNGSVIQQSGGGSIRDLGGGWYRVSVESALLSGSIVQAYLSLVVSTTDSYTGDGASGIYLWNSMLDDKPLGPEIITTGFFKTIAAETQIIDGVNFSSLWGGAATIYMEAGSGGTATNYFWQLDTNNNSNRRLLRADNLTRIRAFSITNNSINFGPDIDVPDSRSTGLKTAVAIDDSLGSFAFAAAGQLRTSTVPVPPTPTHLRIGNSITTNAELNGYVKRLVVFNRALPASTLQRLTL